MPLKLLKSEIEVEREIGYKYLQMQARAEALVPGAGREAIEPLLWDANAVIIRADVQNDRVVLDGTLNCQAVYRQGEETSLRALSAKANISQVTEIPGAQGGMLSRIQPVVEDVETRYENGHMVFLVSLGVHVRVIAVKNRFFGESVTVSGLITGRDLTDRIADEPAARIFITECMLRSEGDRFLDDMTLEEAEARTGRRIVPVGRRGSDLLDALLEARDELEGTEHV